MRKEYKIEEEKACDTKSTEKVEKKEETKQSSTKSNAVKGYLLFGTKTCPNCEIAKKKLKEKNVAYEFIDAEEMVDLTEKYEVMSAPTLVTINEDGYDKVVNASNIISYIDGITKA